MTNSQTKSCSSCSQQFSVTDTDIQFYDKLSPVINGKKFQIPEPELCPDCRCQLRVSHRNEANLYHNKSALSGKQIISLFSSEKPHKVFAEEEWSSDEWDAMDYGRDFNFNRNFFEQFSELDLDVPRSNLMTIIGTNENSPYTTGTGYCKNCHLINSSENCEDCFYSKLVQTCKNVIDSTYVNDSEIIYECFSVRNCYSCFYLSYSQNCTDCYFSENLNACKDCFLCTNLTQKQYCFMNEQLTKEEYKKRIEGFLGSNVNTEKLKNVLKDLSKKRIHKYSNIVACENCSGDFLQNSKNCIDSYDVTDSEDCKYIQVGLGIRDVMDSSNMYIKPELCYYCLGALEAYNVIFSIYIFHSSNVMYSQQCYNCENIFGCSGLRHKKYCIFNKQYTKEEYEVLVPQIIEHMQKTGEWGKFFPKEMSPYGYNETLDNDYFPLTREEALRKGFKWYDGDSSSAYQGPNYEIPDNIQDVSDDICNAILECEVMHKSYKIMPQELDFYRKNKLSIPRRCPDQRHIDRMQARNPRKLWDRNCSKCNTGIKTTYSPDRFETIYCETCYKDEVYS
jgi:hypothetical protein